MTKVNWTEIKSEYVTTDCSYRDLSSKYGVSKTQICNRSRDEGWREQRDKFKDNLCKRVEQSASDSFMSRRDRLMASVDKLQLRVDQLLDLEDAMAPRDLKSISSLLMDIKMICGVKDEQQEEEQAKDTVTVVFRGNDWEEDNA